eukprot:TRINITY_DN34925_c0_g1_i1.p1 TRINITY_DN34925_c0_g1~~TRINITY_DN34925_c0_g1_i1.p1  ORF type:complete len:463 (-),score=79.24 TRINITY_DN34925_c0_g1_i1:141-1529(-)
MNDLKGENIHKLVESAEQFAQIGHKTSKFLAPASRFLNLRPEWWKAHYFYALALKAKGNTPAAIETFQRALNLHPSNPFLDSKRHFFRIHVEKEDNGEDDTNARLADNQRPSTGSSRVPTPTLNSVNRPQSRSRRMSNSTGISPLVTQRKTVDKQPSETSLNTTIRSTEDDFIIRKRDEGFLTSKETENPLKLSVKQLEEYLHSEKFTDEEKFPVTNSFNRFKSSFKDIETYYRRGQFRKDIKRICADARAACGFFKPKNRGTHKFTAIFEVDHCIFNVFPAMKMNNFHGIPTSNLEMTRIGHKPITEIVELIQYLCRSMYVILVSSRAFGSYDYTVEALDKHGLTGCYEKLYVRESNHQTLSRGEFKKIIRERLREDGWEIFVIIGDQESDFVGEEIIPKSDDEEPKTAVEPKTARTLKSKALSFREPTKTNVSSGSEISTEDGNDPPLCIKIPNYLYEVM